MNSLLRRTLGVCTATLLLGGLAGCGVEMSPDAGEPAATLELGAKSEKLTVDSSVSSYNWMATSGGSGGSSFADLCPSGYVGTGVKVGAGSWVDSVQLICRKLNLDGSLAPTPYYTERRGGSGGLDASADCGTSNLMVGQLLAGGSFVDRVGVQCASVSRVRTAAGGYDFKSGSTTGQSETCPAGRVVTGIYGRASSYVDQLGFICGKLNELNPTISYGSSPQFNFQVMNVRINGAAPSATLSPGQQYQLALDYSLSNPSDPSLPYQLVVGETQALFGSHWRPEACIFNGYPGSAGTQGNKLLTLTAPPVPGTYTLRVNFSSSASCDLSLGGEPDSGLILGELEVR